MCNVFIYRSAHKPKKEEKKTDKKQTKSKADQKENIKVSGIRIIPSLVSVYFGKLLQCDSNSDDRIP